MVRLTHDAQGIAPKFAAAAPRDGGFFTVLVAGDLRSCERGVWEGFEPTDSCMAATDSVLARHREVATSMQGKASCGPLLG